MQTYEIASGKTQERYPVIGAAALDLMASIAGPTWAPDHERAWSSAFEIVATALGDHDFPAAPAPALDRTGRESAQSGVALPGLCRP